MTESISPRIQTSTLTSPRHHIEKFGVQKQAPPLITVWLNGEKFDEGHSYLVSNVKTMDQLQRKLAEKFSLMPYCKLYTPTGHLIKNIDEIAAHGHYVAVKQGTKFTKESIPPACPKCGPQSPRVAPRNAGEESGTSAEAPQIGA